MSELKGDQLIEHHYYDIGVAVGTEKGLVVPVLRDCDQMSFAEIEQGIVGYAEKAGVRWNHSRTCRVVALRLPMVESMGLCFHSDY